MSDGRAKWQAFVNTNFGLDGKGGGGDLLAAGGWN